MKALESAISYLEELEPDFDDEGMLNDNEYERQLGRDARPELEEAKLWRQRALNAEQLVRDLREGKAR